MTISEQTAVGDIAATVPGSVRVFERHGVDFCCGGRKTLAAACEEAGLSVADITTELAAVAGTAAPEIDWTREPLGRLVDHILATYHVPLHDGLPVLDTLAARVARAHGARSQALVQVRQVVADLVTELTTHMRKEEVILFPMIRRIEAGQPVPMPIDAPIDVMEREHDHAGDLLQRLRFLTEDYVPPAFACDTLRALYRELDALEQAMHVHVHLENNVLFPRAVEQSHAAGR